MSNENTSGVMSIESLQLKIENQKNIINQLSGENEELYQQYSHLMIRNNKLLKRVDDLQGIIDDLHIRIEELQLINGNMLKLNDRIRSGKEVVALDRDTLSIVQDDEEKVNEELKNKTEANSVFIHWKNYPGQDARNEPNLRKQAQMLIHLYRHKALRASELFAMTGVGGVTGARYVATLKRFGLINYTGARKKGQYEMTRQGIEFLEKVVKDTFQKKPMGIVTEENTVQRANYPAIEQQGIPVKGDAFAILSTQSNESDL